MKINEIIEPQVNTSRHSGKFDRDFRKGNSTLDSPSRIGGGFFYTAHTDEDNPHEVEKRSRRWVKEREDGYRLYVKALLDNNLPGNNIFAPVIYNVKEIVDDDGYKHYDFKMERLIHHHQLSSEEMEHVLNTIFIPEEAEDVIRSSNGHVGLMQDKIAFKLHQAVRDKDEDHIKAKDLLVILKLIGNVNYDRLIDIKSDNIMYRRTPSGVQLVMSDPIA